MTHPLAGRKQRAEHVARRVASTLRARAAWTPEQRALVSRKCAENARKATPWRKGGNWRLLYTPERVREIIAERRRRFRQRTPGIRIHESCSAMIRQSLRGGKVGRGWESLVGYTGADLRAHIEALFQPGMGWSNYGQWHLDHVRPRASFSFASSDDPAFLECWALSNLQPLWAQANLKKGARQARRDQ